MITVAEVLSTETLTVFVIGTPVPVSGEVPILIRLSVTGTGASVFTRVMGTSCIKDSRLRVQVGASSQVLGYSTF